MSSPNINKGAVNTSAVSHIAMLSGNDILSLACFMDCGEYDRKERTLVGLS